MNLTYHQEYYRKHRTRILQHMKTRYQQKKYPYKYFKSFTIYGPYQKPIENELKDLTIKEEPCTKKVKKIIVSLD